MSDFIRRGEALEALKWMPVEDTDAKTVQRCIEVVSNLPSVDAEPVRHAKWIKHEYAEESESLLIPNYECSECHMWERKESDYCPNCGKRMMEK